MVGLSGSNVDSRFNTNWSNAELFVLFMGMTLLYNWDMSLIKSNICEFRIGVSEAGLTPFFVADIAPPNTSQYTPFSATQSQSDGGRIQEGYRRVEMTWVNPSAMSVFRIKKFVESALEGSKQLYMTIPKNDGSTVASREFNNVFGNVYPLLVREQGKMAGRGIVYQSLTLVLNNVVILGVV